MERFSCPFSPRKPTLNVLRRTDALSDQSCRRVLVFGREFSNINADEVFDRDKYNAQIKATPDRTRLPGHTCRFRSPTPIRRALPDTHIWQKSALKGRSDSATQRERLCRAWHVACGVKVPAPGIGEAEGKRKGKYVCLPNRQDNGIPFTSRFGRITRYVE